MLDDFKYASLIFFFFVVVFLLLISYLLSEKKHIQNQRVGLTVCFWSITSHVIFLECHWL